MNVLVAGCGYVGSALAAELAAAGHRVWGLRRDPSGLPAGVLPLAADLCAPSSLDAIDGSIDRLVYTASPEERTERAYDDAYVRGLANVLAALERRRAPLARVILTSSTAVYAQDDGGLVDERSPTDGSRFAGRALLEAEAMLAGRSFEGAALRLAGIYGPGRAGLVRRVHRGEAPTDPPGATPRYGNRIHRDDCAGALAHLLALSSVDPVYVGVDDAPAPLGEVYAYVAGLLGVDPPRAGGGARSHQQTETSQRAALALVDGAPSPRDGGATVGAEHRRERTREGGPVGIYSQRGEGLEKPLQPNKRCCATRLRASGYALRVPSYREGYPPIVEDYLASVRAH